MQTLKNLIKQIPQVKLSYLNPEPVSDRLKFTDPSVVYNYLFENWDKDTIGYIETFKVVFANRRNELLGSLTLSTGSTIATVVSVKMIMQAALLVNAESILLAHNHPSSGITPSKDDIVLTKKVKDACTLLDITLMDHLIITQEQGLFTSFSNEGLL